MESPSIVSVLGFLTLLTLLSGCLGKDTVPVPLEIRTKPVEKPELILPTTDVLRMRDVEWTIITENNYEEVFTNLGKDGKIVAIFGLSEKGYSNLGLNLSDLRAYIQQQQSIILAYKNYYENAEAALAEAVIVEK
jgi:ABC-type uncharacterized transport system ATPase subunit